MYARCGHNNVGELALLRVPATVSPRFDFGLDLGHDELARARVGMKVLFGAGGWLLDSFNDVK